MHITRFRLTNILMAMFLLVPSITLAHDFWIAPADYYVDAPATVPVDVMIGHPDDRLRWPVAPHRIVGYRTFGPDGVRDQQAVVFDYETTKSLPVRLDTPGLHILTIETTPALSELSADKFNSYLEEEGLTGLQMKRERLGEMETSGTELYSRRGKTLLQSGPISDIDMMRLRHPLGLSLEVIALDHPLNWQDGQRLRAKVLYRGKMIPGIKVKLVNTQHNDISTSSALTDAEGVVEFDYPGAGTWMLHTVWGDRIENNNMADYSTIFSSLSFEVR